MIPLHRVEICGDSIQWPQILWRSNVYN